MPAVLARSASEDELSDVFSMLSIVSDKRSRLQKLDNQLSDLQRQKGLSNRKFKEIVKNQNICLGNCKSYPTDQDLRNALNSKKNRVSRHEAKRYPVVRFCLVQLSKSGK